MIFKNNISKKGIIFIVFFISGFMSHKLITLKNNIQIEENTENLVVSEKDYNYDNDYFFNYTFVYKKENNKTNEDYDLLSEEISKNTNEEQIRIRVQSGDSLYVILRKSGYSSSEIHYISEEIRKDNKNYLNIRPNNLIVINKEKEKNISVDLYRNEIDFLRIARDPDNQERFIIYEDSLFTETKTKTIKGKINSSLSTDGRRSGLTIKQISELADIFAWDIDFTRDLHQGNEFKVVFEKRVANEKVVGTGNILAAYFKTSRGEFYAFAFEEDNKVKYFDIDGNSLQKAFLRAPVEFERVTSRFTNARFHPVLKVNRPHRGVDYGGALNTPIMSVGDGVIKRKERQNGYGNFIMIDHGNGYETLYAHLNKFNNKFKVGSRVKQGEIIGYMGQTGLATGVHLHYEMRLNGEYKDPLKIDLPNGLPVKDKNSFEKRKLELQKYLQ